MSKAEWSRTCFPWTYQLVIDGNWLAADIECQIEVSHGGRDPEYTIQVWTIDGKLVDAPAEWREAILADIRAKDPDTLAECERNAREDEISYQRTLRHDMRGAA